MINNKVGLGSLGHPGIFIGQTRVKGLTNHLDIPYVTALEGAQTDKLDFGVLDLWALKQRTDSPLLSLAVENAQIIYTDADYYTFELPSAAEGVTRLISGGLDRDKFGMDGEEIPFIVSRRDLSPGAMFKFDLTSPVMFKVVNRIPEQVGEHYRVWASLVTNAQVPYVTKAEFIPQRQIIKLADTRGLDFSAHESTWGVSGVPSLMKFKNYLTNVKLQQAYRVTEGAVEMLNHETRFDSAQLKGMENMLLKFYSVRGIADNKVINMNTAAPQDRERYMQQIQDSRVKGLGHSAMVSFLDNVAINLMLQQNNNLGIWGPAANSLVDGYDSTRLAPGVWFQLDQAGYKTTYDIGTFDLNVLGDAIKDYEFGKVEMRESVSTNVYVIRTGRGGQEIIFDAFLKAGFDIPAQVQNTDHGFLRGDANNLVHRAARIVEFQLKTIGILRVEWEPGFDPVTADEIVNPILASGYRLSSYTMLIEDYNTSGDNIAIIRKKSNSKISMRVTNGTACHPIFSGSTSIAGQNVMYHNADDDLNGYKVKFSGTADTMIVKDPTKLLKLVPNNPKLGRANL
jgi:hypothetical protein